MPSIALDAQLGGNVSSPARFIVRDTLGLPALKLTCFLLGCQVVQAIGDPNGQLFVIQTSGLLNAQAFLTRLLASFGIADAEPDLTGNTPPPPTDTMPWYAYDQVPISYYGATVWEGYVVQTPNQIVRTSSTQSSFNVAGGGTIVALIDTGVDPNNSILAPHLVGGYDFTRNMQGGSEMGDVTQSTAGVIDGSGQTVGTSGSSGVVNQSTAGVIDGSQYSAFGHGTMTAGIVHLVAPNASLMPLKSFNADGTGYVSDVLRAIYYAVNHNAKVINMSFEFTTPSVELATAITYATSKSVICVASAGNDASITIVYPSGLPNVIDVASTSNNNTPSWFSNYGTPPVWISAPGEAVLTTYPYGTYAVGWGTSFSAPFVSGTVALMASLDSTNAGLLNQATAAQALSHAQPIPQTQYGFGVLDTYQALQAWQNFLSVNVAISCSSLSCQATVQ
ncbi:MAG TPA: S8 family serine peptidase [Terriglobales bacterium]|nr:S8 family serine peptidase [Terriglobales bacterium]